MLIWVCLLCWHLAASDRWLNRQLLHFPSESHKWLRQMQQQEDRFDVFGRKRAVSRGEGGEADEVAEGVEQRVSLEIHFKHTHGMEDGGDCAEEEINSRFVLCRIERCEQTRQGRPTARFQHQPRMASCEEGHRKQERG